MCQNSTREVPLQMVVNLMCELTRQVKENSYQCREILPADDSQLTTAFVNAEQAATQLHNQLIKILRELEWPREEEKKPKTMITFFE